MKKLLVILILGILSCKKEIPNIVTPIPQTKVIDTKVIDTKIQPFIKIKTQVSSINIGTSFYNKLDKDYNPFSKFKSLISPKDHIGAAWSYIDFDKDGDDDFIVATQPDNSEIEQTNHIYLIKNDGGNFSLWKTLNGFVFPRRGLLGDYDGNGYLDYLVADQGLETDFAGALLGIVYFYKDSVALKYIPNSKEFNHTAASGDIDMDGDIDIITADSKYINDGKGNFAKLNATTENIKAGYFHNQLYDLDNDGKLDAIFGGSEIFGDSIYDSSPRKYNGNNRIYWNDGLGNYSYTNSNPLPLTYTQTKDTFTIVDDFNFIDFNNDGYQDIIVLKGCWKGVGYYIQFLQNNKNKTFTEVTEQYIDFYKFNIPDGKPNDFEWLGWIRLVDLNKDNKLDIIGREGMNIEMKWINDGNNHFKLQK